MLKKLSDDTQIEGVPMFLYSENGAGKTFWAGSAGDDWVYVTDRNGIATLKSKLFREKVGTNPFIVEFAPELNPLRPAAFDSFRNQVDNLFIPENRNKWRGIIIDDINTLRLAARNKAIELNGLTNRSQTFAKGASGKFKGAFLPTEGDFGTEMGLVENFLREFTSGLRAEGKHCIVGAHQRQYRTKVDEKGPKQVTAIKPLLTGADTPDILPGIFDLVWYLRTVGIGQAKKREFVTESQGLIMAKTRWGGLFKEVESGLSAKDVFDRIELWQKEGK